MDYLRLLCFVRIRLFFQAFPSIRRFDSFDVPFLPFAVTLVFLLWILIFFNLVCMHLMRMAHAQTHRDNVGWKFLLNDDDYGNDVDHHSIIRRPHAHISFLCRSFQPNERRNSEMGSSEAGARAKAKKMWQKANYVCSYQNISLWSLAEQRETNVSFTRMHMRCSEHTDELKHTKHNKYVSICSAIIPHTQLWQCMLCAHSV